MTDVMAVVGVAAIVGGLAAVWWPLALVVGGVILVATAVGISYVKASEPDKRG